MIYQCLGLDEAVVIPRRHQNRTSYRSNNTVRCY